MKELLSIREYSFDDGTKLTVKIDFAKNEVSLVERNGNEYRDKNWLFAGRGLEYMNGWLNILSAMQYVIKEAQKELDLQDLLDSQISESVSPDYELKYCEDHGTMTNHLNGVCQKGQNDE